MANSDATSADEVEATIRNHRGWFIGLGILLTLLGIVAIVFPYATTIAAKVAIGWLFLIGGIAEIVQSFSTKTWKAFFGNLLVGILYVLAGFWLAFFPLTGVLSLTLFLAFALILEGFLKLGMGFQIRQDTGWGWMVFSALMAILAGILLISGLPGTAVWAIGLLVGVNLLSAGVAYLMIGLTTGKN